MRIGRPVATMIAIGAIALLASGTGSGPGGTPGACGKLTIGIAAGEHWLRGARAEAAPKPAGEPASTGDAGDAPEPASEGAPTGDAGDGGDAGTIAAEENAEIAAGGEGPQVAIWLEDPTGGFVSTIYVTRRAAVEDWVGVAGADDGETVTPRPLPVWAGKHRGIGIEPMASCGACHGKRRSDDKTVAGDTVLEALTGPSPTAGLTREWQVSEKVEPGVYGIRVEVNHWMDPNQRYAAERPPGEPDSSGGPTGSGQPSLVWGGIVEIGTGLRESGLTLIGRGHPSGANGEVDSDLAGLTTALSIVDTIHVVYTAAD